ncbi:MAG: BMP family ABC transporter substrate-binding protein, partial [Coleofasciculaceae cyanobacterium SM2_1_6]|nr:BMP family ABC transporter substrate-binding protein [Coleofasciculaceae cyanobacterium SM2_1_6]
MIKRRRFLPALALSLSLLINACGGTSPTTSSNTPTTASPGVSGAEKKKVGIILDRSENDKSFNEYSLKGAREAAQAAGLDFSYVVATSTSDIEKNIETQVNEGAGLVITVGFVMADATAAMAKKYPDVKFAIVDVSYPPGADGVDPYTKDLKNVTSLIFAEDQVAFLAGALAACVSEKRKIAVVAGMEIPPVPRGLSMA